MRTVRASAAATAFVGAIALTTSIILMPLGASAQTVLSAGPQPGVMAPCLSVVRSALQTSSGATCSAATATPTPTAMPTGGGPTTIVTAPRAALQIQGSPTPTPAALQSIVPAPVQHPTGGNPAGTGVNVTFGGDAPSTMTLTLTPMEARTNLVQMIDQGGFLCGPSVAGEAPYEPDPSSVLAGYYNRWDDGWCWFHEGEIYRGAILFSHPAIRWDHIVSAKLYYRSHLLAVKDSDGSFVYGADYCGSGDQILVADNSTWWNNPKSGNGSYPMTHDSFDTRVSEYIWPWHSWDDMNALPSGSPLGKDTDSLTPPKGPSGVDITALVQNWQEWPGDNDGLIIRNTESEGMAADHSACMTEYSDVRLEITYTGS